MVLLQAIPETVYTIKCQIDMIDNPKSFHRTLRSLMLLSHQNASHGGIIMKILELNTQLNLACLYGFLASLL